LFLGAVVWEEIDSGEDMEVAVGLKGGRIPFSRQRPMSNLSQHRRHDFRLSCHIFLLNFLELEGLWAAMIWNMISSCWKRTMGYRPG